MDIFAKKILERLITIFIVDKDLKIHQVEVAKEEWEHKACLFLARVNKECVIAHRGDWTHHATFAGFATKEEAEDFIATKPERMK